MAPTTIPVSEAVVLVKKHFDTYKKTVKNGPSATTQVRNYYNHFLKLLNSHEFDEEDCNTPVNEFFDELVKDPNFNHADRMPDRWSRKTWAMSFESLVDCATVLKDTLGDARLQKVIEAANKYNTIYSNPDANVKEIDIPETKSNKKVIDTTVVNPEDCDDAEDEDGEAEDGEDGEDGEEEDEDTEKYGSNFDFSNISKLFGNFGGAPAEPAKPDKRIEIMHNMMRKLASVEQDQWPNVFCDTIADLLV